MTTLPHDQEVLPSARRAPPPIRSRAWALAPTVTRTNTTSAAPCTRQTLGAGRKNRTRSPTLFPELFFDMSSSTTCAPGLRLMVHPQNGFTRSKVRLRKCERRFDNLTSPPANRGRTNTRDLASRRNGKLTLNRTRLGPSSTPHCQRVHRPTHTAKSHGARRRWVPSGTLSCRPTTPAQTRRVGI